MTFSDVNMNLTLTWQVSAVVHRHTPASTLPDPPLSHVLAPRQSRKALFWKNKPSTVSPLSPSPVALSLLFSLLRFFFSFAACLSFLSPWDCFTSTCSCQISVSCHLSVVNRQLRRLGPGLRGAAAVVEGLRVQVSVTLSLLCLVFPPSLFQGHGWALPSGDAGPRRSQGAHADGGR